MPDVVAEYVDDVAPVIAVPFFFQTYVNPVPEFELSVTELPEQKVVLPIAAMVAEGTGLTVTLTTADVSAQLVALLMITV